MSLRRDRVRLRNERERLPPSVWRALYAWSPLLSLLGAAAGGVFIIRLILVSLGGEYSFGPDIPVAGCVLLLWGLGVWAFLSPPQAALAQEADGALPSGVIWPLGRRFRSWNVLAAPVLGMLLGMLSGPGLQVVTDAASGLEPELVFDPVLLLFLSGCVMLGTFITARLPLWGAEVRADRLIARGVLLTRRYPRSDIAAVQFHHVTGLADWVLGILFNSPSMVFYVLRVQLKTGRTKTLWASHSSSSDIHRAARIVTAWLTAESVLTAPAS